MITTLIYNDAEYDFDIQYHPVSIKYSDSLLLSGNHEKFKTIGKWLEDNTSKNGWYFEVAVINEIVTHIYHIVDISVAAELKSRLLHRPNLINSEADRLIFKYGVDASKSGKLITDWIELTTWLNKLGDDNYRRILFDIGNNCYSYNGMFYFRDSAVAAEFKLRFG